MTSRGTSPAASRRRARFACRFERWYWSRFMARRDRSRARCRRRSRLTRLRSRSRRAGSRSMRVSDKSRPASCDATVMFETLISIPARRPAVAIAAASRRAIVAGDAYFDRRRSWIVDGTLIPTRDHVTAARSKNYRWSCNVQVLVRRDLRVIAVGGGGPGNRNDPIHYRGSAIELLCRHHRRVLADGGYRGQPYLVTPRFRGRCIVRDQVWRRHRRRRARVEHAIGRLKNWRVLRDHRRRGQHLLPTVRAVAYLHNLRIELRDIP